MMQCTHAGLVSHFYRSVRTQDKKEEERTGERVSQGATGR